MDLLRWMGLIVLPCGFGAAAFAQHLAPIADPVTHRLLPSGILKLPIELNAQLAHTFRDEDGTTVLLCLGDFAMVVGEQPAQTLKSKEAVVWISQREHDGHPYRHMQVLLWKDAEIREVGGTMTSGPALFVTLDTFGEIKANVDDVSFESSSKTPIYRRGEAVRHAIMTGKLRGSDEQVHMRVFDASGLSEPKGPAPPRPLVNVRSGGDLTFAEAVDGRRILTVTGGVYLSRGAGIRDEHLELQADAVVIFLPPAPEMPPAGPPGASGLGGETDESRQEAARGERPGPGGAALAPERRLLSTGLGDVEVEAAYLEGDVVMRQGPNMIRASRLYYDFRQDRALILDAVARAVVAPEDPERSIPLYVRAAEIRQLAQNHFSAENAILTTSEFHTPHYHVGARHVELINRTPRDLAGQQRELRTGTFIIRQATLNLGGHPLMYWPHLRGNIGAGETAIKSVRSGYSDDWGVELETRWYLFNVLGLETPDGFDSTLHLDYFSERGPAIGADVDYERDTYFGLLRSYLIHDSGEDFLGRDREQPSKEGTRGRFLLRHRQYLEDDWQLSLELSYISDASFLEEFFEDEFDNDKEQETLLYLKKQHDNRALTIHLQSHILDFVTETERLPDITAYTVGEPFGDRATRYSESRLGFVRYRPKDQTFQEFLHTGPLHGSSSVGRVDSRQEVGMPLDVGPVRLVPFAVLRGTAWDDSPDDGGIARIFGTYGIHGTMYLSRTFPDVKSTLLDVDGIRHVIKPDVTAWISHTNRDSDELYPFDETVEEIDEIDGVMLGLRQRWQTKRGEQETRRTVDFLTWDLELGVFNDAQSDDITNGFTSYSRPENSISHNYLNSSVIWRLNDRTALLSTLNYDINDGEIDVMDFSLAVERPPRLSYLVGYRFINESDSELLGFGMDYRLSDKHTLALRELFDVHLGRNLDFTVALIRKFPHWFGALSFALDDVEDDFGVSFSVWPAGLPQSSLGSRRFTGLGPNAQLPQLQGG